MPLLYLKFISISLLPTEQWLNSLLALEDCLLSDFFISSQSHLHLFLHTLWLRRTTCNSLNGTANVTFDILISLCAIAHVLIFLPSRCLYSALWSMWTSTHLMRLSSSISSSLKASLISVLSLPSYFPLFSLPKLVSFLCWITYCACLRSQRSRLRQMLHCLPMFGGSLCSKRI